MACIFGDQPERVQMSPKGVVHAASYINVGGFYIHKWKEEDVWIPKEKKLFLACKRASGNVLRKWIVNRNTPITCKNCLKAMGLLDEQETKRYVVFNTKTKEFFKNTNSNCSQWSEDIYESFLFRREHTAEQQCMVWRYRVKDTIMNYIEWADAGKPEYILMNYKEWVAAGRPEHYKERIKDKNLEVKRVILSIDE